ncbi:MAG: hypothetical protein P8075_11955 [Deltaproteobacteria bacterium]|jgi:hypothetical protein
MAEKLIETLTLPNGLMLELWDKSRPMAGDRWLIALLAKVEVPVLPEYFSALNNSDQAYRDLLAAYSDPLVFTQEKTRHFVDEKNTDDVLAELCQRFKDNLLSYLGNPRFAPLYVMKKYGDLQDRKSTSGR